MGGSVSSQDFYWAYDDEPHATRRKLILAKYPEMKKLMQVDPTFKYKAAGVLVLQLLLTAYASTLSWPMLLLLTYVVGATINHALLVAVHEASHGNAFGHSRPWANKIYGMIYNLPIGLPIFSTFKRYHMDHHKYQGDEVLDVDLPTQMEGRLFANSISKLFFVVFQFAFYGARPLFVRLCRPIWLDGVNAVMQLLFDLAIWYVWGWKSIFYLIIGTFMGMGFHPTAGHFISDHYMFQDGFETYSYYGCLNFVTFNYGYHNEHHDFPNIPCSYLPKVREIAPEFYNTLPYHTSWIKVIYDYIMDPSIGPYARVKRKTCINNGIIQSKNNNVKGKNKSD